MYFRRKLFATSALIAAGLLAPAGAFAQSLGPQGGAVAAGAASIAQSGRQPTVTQSSAKAIVEWRRFDVDPGSSVQFVQPGRDSITLNRVRAGEASRIDGSVSANGQVYVVNPNGVLIGPSGRINAAGFVASTHDVRDQDFMAGKMDFSVTSPNAAARVRNEGVIAAGDGGYAVLAGSRVENAGVISARVGQVGLAGGDAVALDVVGDRLLQFQVTKPVSRDPGGAILSNTGTLSAPGGVVTLSAQAARSVIRDVINTTGVIEAQGVTVDGGRVIIHGGDSGTVQVGGSIDVSNAIGVGGQVDVRGEKVGLIDGARIDASGAAGGGTVLVGGDWQGKGQGTGAGMTAQVAYVAPTASINVDATQNGNGGKAVVWAEDATRFNGSISARGGVLGGDGGQVETSGKRALDVGAAATVTTAARAPKAKAGAWLLDPTDITISTGGGVTSIASPYAPGATSSVTPNAITAALATGAVTIQTGDGTITVASPISYSGAASSLTLSAGLDILLSSSITSSANALNVTLSATRAITVSADVTTLGGSFSATANSGGIAGTTNGYSQTAGKISTDAGAITINARAANSGPDGVAITGGTLTTTSGAISITGVRGGGTGARNILVSGALISADSGAVTITGTSSAGGAGNANHGVLIQSAATISTVGGNLSISGTSANLAAGAQEGQDGLFIKDANTLVQTVSGSVTLTGATSFVGAQAFSEGAHLAFGASVLATGSGGITVNGTATAAIDAGIFIETNSVLAANGAGAVNLNGFSDSTGAGVVVWPTGRLGSASATGPLTITTDRLFFDFGGASGTVQGAGALVIKPSTISTSIGVAGGTGTLNLSALTLAAIADGFSSRAYGRADGTGVVTVNALSSPDALILNGGSITIAGAVTTSGADAITINANRTIAINDNLIASGAGAIVVTANAGGLGDGVGLSLASGKKITSAGGDIQLTGNGGSSVAGDGIAINGGTVSTTGSGAITFTGARGAATLNETNRNIYTSNALISTASGALTFAGSSLAGGGFRGHGVYIDAGSTITTTSGGAITMTGGRGADDNSHNVVIRGPNTVVSTTGSGSVSLVGTSAAGGVGSFSFGVLVDQAGTVSTVGGAITFTGVGASNAGTGQMGVALRGGVGGALVQTQTGQITLTGDAAANTTLSDGVRIDALARVLGLNNGSALSITGSSVGASAVLLETGGTVSVTGAGALTLTGDTLSVDSTSAIQGQGALTIQPKTVSASVGVAGGAGVLNISSAILTQIAGTFASRTFGRADGTGALTINAHASPDPITLRGGSIVVAGAVTTTGSDAIAIAANRTLAINDNLVTGGAGAITLTANGGGLGDGAGLTLASGKQISSAGGDIQLTGTGGSSVAGDGIAINGGTIATTGAGAISLTGARGSATLDDFNRNIYITGAQITTASGAITLTGTATAGGGSRGHGIYVNTGSTITTTNGGAIVMTGARGQGLNGHNVVIRGPNTVVSTTASGALSLTGTSTAGGNGDFSFGVLVDEAGTVATAGGALSLTGVGASSAFNGQIGVALRGGAGPAVVSSATGAISINGSSPSSTGVFIDGSSRVTGLSNGSSATITSVGGPSAYGADLDSGTVSVIGGGSVSIDGQTIHLAGASVIGAPTLTGGLTLTTDAIALAGGSTTTLQGQGALTIRPRTLTTSIGIAGGAGGLSLTTALLGQIAGTFSSRTIGRSDGTGTITINAHASPDPLTIAGGAMTIAGALTTSGTDSLTLSAKGVVAVNADIATATGALTVYADASTAAGGGDGLNVSATGRIVSSGGNVTVTGVAPAAGADGVALIGGTIATTGAGTVTISGTRATGAATGRNIQIQGANARVTTDAGSLSLVGTATAGGNANSVGVQIEQGGVVSTNSGALAIFGNGSVSTSAGQAGVAILTGSSVESSSGAISITGVGGSNGAVGFSEGFFMDGGSRLRGLATGSSVAISANSFSGVSAGAYLTNGTIEVSGGGALSIDSNQDIYVVSNSFVGKVGATGSVTLTVNGLSMYQPAGGGVAGTIAGAGALTIQPKTLSRAVNIGGAVGAGGLELSNLTLAQIQDGFSSRIFGRSDATGLTTVYSHASPDSLSILSGGATGDITVAGSLSVSGADRLTLVAGRKVTLNSGASLSSSASGDAITIANNGFAGSSFVNNAGGSVLSAPTGRWLVYSVDPSTDTVGGLSAAAGTQFNKTYAAQPPATITGTVNYLIYSAAGAGAPPPTAPVVATPEVTPPVVTPPVVTPPVVAPPVVIPPVVTPPVVTPPVVTSPVITPSVTPLPVVTVARPTSAEIAAAEEARRQALIDVAEKTAVAKTLQAQAELASVIKTLPPGSAATYLSTEQAQQAIVDAAGKGVAALSPDLVVAVVNVLGSQIMQMMPPPPAPVVANDPVKAVEPPKPAVAPTTLGGRIADAPSFAQVGPSFNAASLLSSIGDIGGSIGSLGSIGSVGPIASIGSFGGVSNALSGGTLGGSSSFSSAPPGVQGAAGGMTGAVFSAPSTVSVVPDDGAEGGGAPPRERTGLGAPSAQEEGETVMPGVLKSFGGQGGRGGNRSPYNTPFFVPLQNEVLRD